MIHTVGSKARVEMVGRTDMTDFIICPIKAVGNYHNGSAQEMERTELKAWFSSIAPTVSVLCLRRRWHNDNSRRRLVEGDAEQVGRRLPGPCRRSGGGWSDQRHVTVVVAGGGH